EIFWKMYDADQQSIKYNAKLYDGIDCGKIDYGTLNVISTGISSQDIANKIQWNGKSTNKNSNLEDGKYCLKICAVFIKQSEYVMCDSQNIRIIFKNKPPSIHTPIPNVTIKQKEYWEYIIKATDPDKDKLTYRIVQGPKFLEITNVGKIRTKDSNWNIPINSDKATYNVIIGVSDGLNDEIYNNFLFSVVKNTTQSSQITSKINFLKPNQEIKVNKTQQKIIPVEINVEDINPLKKLSLDYSNDEKNWTELLNKDLNEKNFTLKYEWDIKNLQPNEYYLKISIVDQYNLSNTRISPKIIVGEDQNTGTTDDNNNETSQEIFFTNFFPENNTTIVLNKLQQDSFDISFKIISNNVNYNDIKIKLNGNSLEKDNCKVENENNKVTCSIPIENINEGLQKVEITSNTINQNYTDSWIFTVRFESESNNFLTSSGIIIIVLLTCSMLVIFIVPWIIIKQIRKKVEDNNRNIQNPNITTNMIEPKLVTPETINATIDTNIESPIKLNAENNNPLDYPNNQFDYSILDNLNLESLDELEKKISQHQNEKMDNTSDKKYNNGNFQ
ncbi:MAG: hypothetical protein NZZ41_05735, partial [Candidatus Dojkabacteria bacterium]|nr:hypothetical protein [Candidatus Dojkabacteria bacterium]